ncbi:hypothetical protein ACFFX0_02395 [Citricoccus parietis]|uniref:Uncharacterized protein n=1 Tax=Citricoccus parietis TaxID=592307 RepID=A0ABV5FTT8_9MICC
MGTKTTSSRSSSEATSEAATRWPWWMGSKVPPMMPRRKRRWVTVRCGSGVDQWPERWLPWPADPWTLTSVAGAGWRCETERRDMVATSSSIRMAKAPTPKTQAGATSSLTTWASSAATATAAVMFCIWWFSLKTAMTAGAPATYHGDVCGPS